MQYDNIVAGKFLERKNRFVAEVEIAGKIERVHVKNTGRCKELFLPNVPVFLQHHDDPNRKTNYSLITVRKGNRLINIDSQAPNKIFSESHILPWKDLLPEKTYQDSRFDFALTQGKESGFVEVKGVTLEVNDVAYFPDAPTQRGIKHIQGLIRAKQSGLLAYLVFVIQMDGIAQFRPNRMTHPAFAQALAEARRAGVELLAYQCRVGEDWIKLDKNVEIVV